ncbi:MAG: threonine--tRNA ligase [Eubacteriales bacterium]|nr:threonine--tRNA ligase [Eubacteriales bacterium]
MDKILNHTAAHVLAYAVKNIYPNTKLAIGPATDSGFYYDFDFATPIKDEDLPKIEAEMARIIKEDFAVERKEVTRTEASRIINKNKEIYKVELLHDIPRGESITMYTIGNFTDLCAGPHVDRLSKIKAFKLTQITGAYWRGDEKNKMLTRIYGVAFAKKSELDAYNLWQEEVKKRDHNKICRELGYYTSSELVGQGLPLFTAEGATILRIMQRFVEDEEIRRGYLHVKTPSFAKSDLYKVSGHWQHYKDSMFLIGDDVLNDNVMALRPMTCPMHILLYRSELRSYKDLPMRFAETAKQFRNENSGEMHGLIRLREYTLSDGHIIVRPDQIQQVIDECMDLVKYILGVLNMEDDVSIRLSKWDPNNKEKYIDLPDAWEWSQNEIRNALKAHKLKFTEADGEAAFYGPKIDIQAKNTYGKEDTLFTIQLDFALSERFGLTYIDENGKKAKPYLIHRSSIGCYERTLAMLIEKTMGNLPVWLSPTQVRVLNITNAQDEYCEQVKRALLAADIRTATDLRNEKIGLKIREATLKKIPYCLIIGAKEQEAGKVAVRTREGQDLGQMTVEEFIAMVKQQVKEFK